MSYIHYGGVCLSENAANSLEKMAGTFETGAEVESYIRSLCEDVEIYVEPGDRWRERAFDYAIESLGADENHDAEYNNEEFRRMLEIAIANCAPDA